MCPNTAEASTLTDALRIQFLDTHNVRRSQLAQGNIGDAGPNRKTKLPPAKNMRELIWDCTLEMEATNHVRACPVAAAGTSTNGENFHRVSSANLQYYRDGVKDAVVAWWKVYRFYSVPRQIYMATHSAASSYTQVCTTCSSTALQ
ncbi:SCP-like protein [Oesophagostomum dentatum]|uniref:SCP-like protein n=1 Tax=Oesophagostomum dentatum TaxID=61180 RepID=A0A0B1TE37_OESDE|nr:SCP-like protein [Oesophagostomum dentatum]